jgi:hypothetical protein
VHILGFIVSFKEMKKFLNLIQPIFVLSIPFLIFLKPENYIEIISIEILYLIILLIALYLLTFIFSFTLLKIFPLTLKKRSLNDLIFIFAVLFFETFYHEKIRDFITNSFNIDTISSFIISLILIIFINGITFIILIKYFHKLKINILIFMILLLSTVYYKNFYLYQSTFDTNKLSYFEKSQLPKKKLNENIYFIILDEMTSLDHFIKQFPGEKDYIENFKLKLEKKNFAILANSMSAYNITYLNITALMNANYFIHEKSAKYISRNSFFPNSIFYKTKNSLQVLDYLIKNNHYMELIGNSVMNFELISSDKNLKLSVGSILIPNIFYKFFEPTFIDEVFRKSVQNFLTKTNESIFIKNNGMNALKNKMKKRNDKGLIFVHHFSPHAPYLFDRNCNKRENFDEVENPKKYNSTLYKNSYICVTKQILELINKINEYDRNGIIVFQGDHSNIQDKSKLERFIIFNAVKIPDSCKENLNSNLNNVNTLRIALYCSSNERPVLLENNSFIGFHGGEKEYGTIKKIR